MVEADPVDYFQLIFVDTSRYQRTLPTSKAPTAHRGGSFILGGFTVLSVGRFSMLKTMRGLSATRLPGSGGRLPCCLALWNSWSWSTDLSGSQQSNLDNDWMLRLVADGSWYTKFWNVWCQALCSSLSKLSKVLSLRFLPISSYKVLRFIVLLHCHRATHRIHRIGGRWWKTDSTFFKKKPAAAAPVWLPRSWRSRGCWLLPDPRRSGTTHSDSEGLVFLQSWL